MKLHNAMKAGLVAGAALFAGAGWAQMPDGPHGQGAEGMGQMRGFERLHKQLNLNPQQEGLWQQARAVQREAFKGLHATGAETRAKLRVEIDKPGIDLKQFAQYRDELREQMHSQMEAARTKVRSAWFGVYDALDAQQREQVRIAIRDGMDRVGHHRGGRRGGPGGEQRGAG